ncbi:hypothetical protein [Halorientalis marina]|jgi:DNA-binding transcriptional ArsR family regulator|uniref:hypothetical protein n=1 Tax=Halorientalis marina TaxID=2931976 RepID=UPI001FF5D2BD|nr:hypothetical protein [Halorientalis marina]
MTGEDRRFNVDERGSLDLRPVGPGSCEWELSFTTPEGEQITVELPPEARHELLTSLRTHSGDSRDRNGMSPEQRDGRQETTADTEEDLPLLPENPTLEFEKYLSMHRALGNQTRYEILRLLVQEGELSPDAIERELAIDEKEPVVDHVETLCDVFLVERWEYTEHGTTETSTTYRPTVFGRVALTDGIHELIRNERNFEEMYDSEASDESENVNAQ